MEQLVERLMELTRRKDRFTFDLRGACQVYTGVVAAYKATQDSEQVMDLHGVIDHAMENEGVIGAWRNPEDGKVQYDSCRVFTDVDQALRFARIQGQRSVYNLNREEEVPVLPALTVVRNEP